MKIDLTTKTAALNYLRSLDPSTEVELPGAYESKPNSAAADAVAVFTDESPNAWAASMNRWEWTAGELATALVIGRTATVTEEGTEAEIVEIHPDGDISVRFSDGEEGSYSLSEIEL